MRGWEKGDGVLLPETFLSWVVSKGSIGMQGVEAAGSVVACVNLDFCHFRKAFRRNGWRSIKFVKGCCSGGGGGVFHLATGPQACA